MNGINCEQGKKFNDTTFEMQKANAAIQDSIAQLTRRMLQQLLTFRLPKLRQTVYLNNLHSKSIRTFLIFIVVAAIIIALFIGLI